MRSGSTRGARHLAESTNWLAWNASARGQAFGTFMESALAHWDVARLAAFWHWRGSLPC